MADLNVNSIGDASGGTTTTVNGLTLELSDRFNEVFEYQDGKLFWKKTLSNVAAVGKEAGCVSSNSYGSVMVDKKAHCTHRIIFCMHHGYMPDQVDHIDGNRKNHRIENLRAANNMTNNMNKGAQSNSKSGIKNVCWNKQNQKWWVQVTAYGKKVVSKMFDDLELAELVAIEARDKYHGAFARS